jgi:RNA polymerase sigma factor (sigma-70 family)
MEVVSSMDYEMRWASPGLQSQGHAEHAVRQHIITALRKLEESERRVLSLSYEYGLTIREMGEVLDIPEAQAEQMQAQAMQQLHAYLGSV